MASTHPKIATILSAQPFAETLVLGLLEAYKDKPYALAQAKIFLPNSRAAQAVRDTFIQYAHTGLLLPRLIVIGDLEQDAELNDVLEPIEQPYLPPAISPLRRKMILAHLLQKQGRRDAADAFQFAESLSRTLDELLFEDIDPQALRHAIEESQADLAEHWQKSLAILAVILEDWPKLLEDLGVMDRAKRRNLLLRQLAAKWEQVPPHDIIIAAGISTTAPAISNLLRVIARLPHGQVILAGYDPALSDEEVHHIEGDKAGELGGVRADESHPQFHLLKLIQEMRVARQEVEIWRKTEQAAAHKHRQRTLARAMQPALLTHDWWKDAAASLKMPHVSAMSCENPAHEAQTIALILRHTLEQPGKTSALVTPDRQLAQSVAHHMKRWGIKADDTAGVKLSQTRIGTLLLSIAKLWAADFSPVELMTLLKHPLVMAGEGHAAWLEKVRTLDLALREPVLHKGIAGLESLFTARDKQFSQEAWQEVKPWLQESPSTQALLPLMQAMISYAQALGGEVIWSRADGKAASALLEELMLCMEATPLQIPLESLPDILKQWLEQETLRDIEQSHPRLRIWGLLEAKLQSVDRVILAGLNEGVWPALPRPDPWLAPQVRRAIGMASLERRIGLSAHDFVSAFACPEVMLVRAERDSSAPRFASRFWLRLEALTGGLAAPAMDYAGLALDMDAAHAPPKLAARPCVWVGADNIPKTLSVTDVDKLLADPYSYYAAAILKLRPLDMLAPEPSASWRGTFLHKMLETWFLEDDLLPDMFQKHIDKMARAYNFNPVDYILWMPNILAVLKTFEAVIVENRSMGRTPYKVEMKGHYDINTVKLTGKFDRIDSGADGFTIIDYKSGSLPSKKNAMEGLATQLGLLGLILKNGGFDGVSGSVSGLEYWSFKKEKSVSGKIMTLEESAQCIEKAEEMLQYAIENWLSGAASFTAKLNPKMARDEYDQLMRYMEWVGRG